MEFEFDENKNKLLLKERCVIFQDAICSYSQQRRIGGLPASQQSKIYWLLKLMDILAVLRMSLMGKSFF
jgi:hypothetical protein